STDLHPPRTIPMLRSSYRARWAVVACAALIGAVVAGCDWKKTLLEPQNPGLIDATAVGSPAAAIALKIGAIGRWKLQNNCTSGECLWQETGMLADEFKNSDFQPDRQ